MQNSEKLQDFEIKTIFFFMSNAMSKAHRKKSHKLGESQKVMIAEKHDEYAFNGLA